MIALLTMDFIINQKDLNVSNIDAADEKIVALYCTLLFYRMRIFIYSSNSKFKGIQEYHI